MNHPRREAVANKMATLKKKKRKGEDPSSASGMIS